MSGVSRLINSYKTSEDKIGEVTDALSSKDMSKEAEKINAICPAPNSNLSSKGVKKNGSNVLMS